MPVGVDPTYPDAASAWLLGRAALASLLEACTVATRGTGGVDALGQEARPPDAANIDAPEAAPRKQIVTDFMARNPDLTIDARLCPAKSGGIASLAPPFRLANFYTTDESLLFAGLVHAMLQPLVVFAVLQRYVIQGLTVGALRD